uniref:AMP-dependent synthetase/ligase domain-containing protein n=1 Tax=Branchiostoma floridae TaxID=7739 RepID=C3YH80_BRAFL|eukprot:XP_002604305.1 hypothetical protein BRAFLDRAFT_125262 [Branchiostoma floridae]
MTSEALNSTVGMVLPHVQLRIADDDGNSVPTNTVGEVVVRGYSVFQQYYGDTAKTAAAKTMDGWYRMGEIELLVDVSIWKELIIKDSENIYPAMIELPLQEHPAVQDVKLIEEYTPGYILFVDSFPKTTNGRKVDRKKLRRAAMEQLGLKELDS